MIIVHCLPGTHMLLQQKMFLCAKQVEPIMYVSTKFFRTKNAAPLFWPPLKEEGRGDLF
jgi:hypothetical protein